MNKVQSNSKTETEIDSKIKEAEVYHSMGLIQESLNIYEELLSGASRFNPQDLKTIKEKVHFLKEEMKDSKKSRTKDISSKDIDIIRSSHSDISDVLDSAAAFKELGLFQEAIVEYEKLFQLKTPDLKTILEFAGCLFEKYAPGKVIEQIEDITLEHNIKGKEKARIKFRLGLEMEKGVHKDLALDLYKTASNIDPEDEEIKNKLNALINTLSRGSRYSFLIKNRIVTSEQLQKALAISKKTRKSVEFVLIDHFNIKKEDVGKGLAFFYNCPFKSFDPEMDIPVELISNLKKSFLLHNVWAPLRWRKKGVEVLIDDPKDLSKTDLIRGLIKNKNIILHVGIKEDIEEFIRHFYDRDTDEFVGDMIEDLDIIPDVDFEEEEGDAEEENMQDETSSQVVRLVDQILVTAYRKNVSDIHVEPSPITKSTGVRFRLDGVCQDYLQAPNSMASGILSRIKIMAGLDISERRLPQDGKIKFRRKGIPSFELRVATLPTAGGFEDAVLRILAKAGAMAIEDMGMNERNLRIMKEIVHQPYGLVLVVGPTGSGKTTSLHAALGHINKPGIKIWTAEDPIEITQAGLRQVEAKPKIGLNFERIMRAFLRADPDVIMIGEMRDKETASIGVEASLTGHLVFSTLHTNSAPETVTRLLDMGLNPLNFSDAFLGVMAQRLVRRLCTACREEYHPTQEEFDDIISDYGRKSFEATGIKFSPDLTLYRARGCEACSGSGYKGRMGIHELMQGTHEIKRLIKKAATAEQLFDQAMKEGMDTLKQDGIQKVFKGMTDIDEIRRVCIS